MLARILAAFFVVVDKHEDGKRRFACVEFSDEGRPPDAGQAVASDNQTKAGCE